MSEHCPNCGSNNVYRGWPRVTATGPVSTKHCNDCGEDWDD